MWTWIYIVIGVIVVAVIVWLIMKSMKKKGQGGAQMTPPSNPQGPMQQPPQMQ